MGQNQTNRVISSGKCITKQINRNNRKGGFGKVWKVFMKRNHKIYALKEMSKVKIIDKRNEKSIINERDFLSNLHHPFIVNLVYAFQDYEKLYLVMDLLNGGDLRYHITLNKRFTEEQTKFFFACLIVGLEYIHENNIIHRDIKPENLVLDERGYIRITDFGIAKEKKRDNSSETSGTPGYMAPEVLCGQNHSFSVDFFAIGVMGYEFMLGERPYIGKNRREIKHLVLKKQARIGKEDLVSGWSKESQLFINHLLQRKEAKRLGYKKGVCELKEHSWFDEFDWEGLISKKLPAPYIPKEDGNYDKKFCERIEKLSPETIERYQSYMKKSDFAVKFMNYTYINNDKKDKQEITHRRHNSKRYSRRNSSKISTVSSSSSNINIDINNNKNNKSISPNKKVNNESYNENKHKKTHKHNYLYFDNINEEDNNVEGNNKRKSKLKLHRKMKKSSSTGILMEEEMYNKKSYKSKISDHNSLVSNNICPVNEQKKLFKKRNDIKNLNKSLSSFKLNSLLKNNSSTILEENYNEINNNNNNTKHLEGSKSYKVLPFDSLSLYHQNNQLSSYINNNNSIFPNIYNNNNLHGNKLKFTGISLYKNSPNMKFSFLPNTKLIQYSSIPKIEYNSNRINNSRSIEIPNKFPPRIFLQKV